MNDKRVITARLHLIPLTGEQLENYLDRKKLFEDELGQVSRTILTPILRRAIEMKLAKMDQYSPRDADWITYWLIQIYRDGFGAGMIGFKGVPDPDGEVEIGYGIDPAYHNLGYATEAVEGMIRWAFADSRCRRIIAPNTHRSNPASNGVLEKVGMRIYDESPKSLSWCLDKADQKT